MKKVFRLPSIEANNIAKQVENITIELLDIQKRMLSLKGDERVSIQQLIDESLMEFITYNE
jgi:hypothetical protein